ncbi:MAG: cytochrome C [Nitrososphaerales archaeon]
MQKKFYTILFLLSASLLLFAAFFSEQSDTEQSNKELIKFSHAKHSDLVECADCHQTASESITLYDDLLPDHESCSDCHNVEEIEECNTCHYDDKFEELVQKKPELIYNHKVHSSIGVKCTDCHKGLDKVDYSFESPDVVPAMEFCSGCHNEVELASNACESCHISTFDLTPITHRNNDFMRGHKFLYWEVDANCMMCHDNNTCQECHVSTTSITEVNSYNDFYPPYAPTNTIDGAKEQIIVKVHNDLNYRYYHGIDAKSSSSNCQTCHQVETFCGNCHQAELRDFAMSGIVPTTHLSSTFTTLGVGSGGGDHATLAQRDIMQCVSCHDVQGADPTCSSMCHMDSDGIEGTDPKTHVSNYMNTEYGDWHSTQASVCYNCHTSQNPSSPSGMGFCGYCHGAN